jgi:CheY-like chemotaxis protein
VQSPATKVLLVDDRREVRAWIADVLLSHAYDVRTAGCGLEALDQMAVWTPDVVVTEIRMPRMNGLELMLRIRQAQRAIGIVAMCEMDGARDAAVATQLGADRFLLKPFGRAELLAAIEAARAVPERSRARALVVPPAAPISTTLRTTTHRWSPATGRPPCKLPAPWRPRTNER